MSKDNPNWEGLLKWSLSHSDGTQPPRQLSEEDRKWFMEAMQSQTIDVVKRMKEITQVMQTPEEVLDSQGVSPGDIEDMLDELQEHVESIDMANDLHSIGGLSPLLGYLKNRHANIRAKAADVVTTVVQNNPRSQQLVMEANGFEPLLTNFTSDPDVKVRTQALGALSSLIRHNKPGVAAFRLANGYAALKDALSSESVRFQRKALHLLHYLLRENRSDGCVVTELGFPRIMIHLASSEDTSVREAALQGLLELARGKLDETTGQSIEDDKLKQLLEERIQSISTMSQEELGAVKEERQLIDSLWNAFYNEPSALREKGLLVLPGEDQNSPPPDVASKHFEPPLRAWAAKREPEKPSEPAKKKTPLLLGPSFSSDSACIQSSSNGSADNTEGPTNASS
ncbi:hsp70-binding protein 1-like [Chenopodium quinoa]|uniref:hsp70-binding protein 1-like n=1 Tax=Chenopodium quinoa TaxID=63459 RepID=UPI000B78CA1E|nr:hsp70-binding protein 1-like [Chenopodium quinoa]